MTYISDMKSATPSKKERYTGIVKRQYLERDEPHEQAYRPRDAGEYHAGVIEFEKEAERA